MSAIIHGYFGRLPVFSFARELSVQPIDLCRATAAAVYTFYLLVQMLLMSKDVAHEHGQVSQ